MKRDEPGVVPPDVVLALRDAVSRSSVDDRRPVFSGRTVGPVVPLQLAALPFKEEAYYESVVGVLAAELLVARDLVGCIGPVRVTRLMCIVPSTLLTHLLFLSSSFAGVSSLLRMSLRISGIRDLLLLGGMLF